MSKVKNAAAALLSVYANDLVEKAQYLRNIGEFGDAQRKDLIAGEIFLARELLLQHHADAKAAERAAKQIDTVKAVDIDDFATKWSFELSPAVKQLFAESFGKEDSLAHYPFEHPLYEAPFEVFIREAPAASKIIKKSEAERYYTALGDGKWKSSPAYGYTEDIFSHRDFFEFEDPQFNRWVAL